MGMLNDEGELMRKIERYAASAVLINHRRQNLAKRIIQCISEERARSELTSGLCV